MRWIFLDRWGMFVLHPFTIKSWQLSSTFEFYWLMTEHVLFERAFTSYNQVFSCKQFDDLFSTDERCLFFIHQKPDSCQARTFEFCWLMTGHVSFGWGDTSYNQVFSCKQFGDFFSTDEQGLPSCKSGSQVLRVIATVLSLPVQVLVHPNAKAAAWWHRPQSVGRCL